MAEKIQHVTIPSNVRVRCPLAGFQLRSVAKCVACDRYAGLQEQLAGEQHSFVKRFTVRCTYPQDRQLFELEID